MTDELVKLLLENQNEMREAIKRIESRVDSIAAQMSKVETKMAAKGQGKETGVGESDGTGGYGSGGPSGVEDAPLRPLQRPRRGSMRG